MKDDLKDRVRQFNTLSLPGQPPMMHMGTSYLVSDLVEEIRRLETEIEALRAMLAQCWHAWNGSGPAIVLDDVKELGFPE